MVEHHALGEQSRERLVNTHQLQVAHDFGPEARIQQVQDGMLDAADVLVHGHPVGGALADHGVIQRGVAIAHEVPGRVHEGVHGVGLAPRCLTTGGTGHAGMKALVFVERVTAAIRDAIFGQHHGQILLRHGDRAVLRAVNDRDGRAPVALAADAPVPQPPGGLLFAQPKLAQIASDGIDRILDAQAVIGARGHDRAACLVGVPLMPAGHVIGTFSRHRDDLHNRNAVLQGKGKVALVMARHAHDRAVAVAHQHIVADPDIDLRTGQRVGHLQAGAHPFLLLGGELGLGGAPGLAGLDECSHVGACARGMHGQRMFRGHRTEGHAHEGVGASGKDMHVPALNRRAVVAADVVREGESHAFAASDPVLLHELHALGPPGQLVLHMVQQLLRILRDLQVIAGDFAFFHHRARTPAAAIDDLLIGQHGLVDRVPVDHLRAALGNAGFQHLQEQPLVPAVVGGIAGRDFAAPVDGQTHRLHLPLHVGDVGVGPLCGRHLVLHGRVLGRQTEGVPAHGHQHVIALHPQMTGQHVVDRVVAHMPHVQLAGGVGQHRAGVVLALGESGVVLDGAIGLGGRPVSLSLGFDFGRKIAILHRIGRKSRWRACA